MPGAICCQRTRGRRIFRERIVPDLLDGRKPQARPTVVFLMGQQGAGKSRVASMAADVLSKRGEFADLDSDLDKPYHPQHDELMSRDDRLMAAYIGPDSWARLAQAHEYARAEKINVLNPANLAKFCTEKGGRWSHRLVLRQRPRARTDEREVKRDGLLFESRGPEPPIPETRQSEGNLANEPGQLSRYPGAAQPSQEPGARS